jgi:hypothetical protein
VTAVISCFTHRDCANSFFICVYFSDHKTFGFEYYGGTWLDKLKSGTAHLSVVGPDGDAVALTSTVNL